MIPQENIEKFARIYLDAKGHGELYFERLDDGVDFTWVHDGRGDNFTMPNACMESSVIEGNAISAAKPPLPQN